MKDKFELMASRWEVERQQDWRGEIDRIPFLKFPSDWAVQVIPPFADAVVRFRVRLPFGAVKSVYLDSRCSLGYMDKPYWEVYPYRGETFRCYMNETDELIAAITDEIEVE